MQEDKYKGMRGEFKGDFTRDTFDPINQYSRVLMQQGRVQLDADWNEQVSIMLHNLRSLACDLGGEHWGSEVAGFKIGINGNNNLTIGSGHYYVKGILCEAGLDGNKSLLYSEQPDYPISEDSEAEAIDGLLNNIPNDKVLLVYLDVWERHITYVYDDTIREVALGGADTATRAKVVWQVKVISIPNPKKQGTNNEEKPVITTNGENFIKPGTGTLCAKVKTKSENDNNPCLVAPESRYRGTENQLYRVEIHNKSDETNPVTFKWSRENASVIFPVLAIDGNKITLEHLGRDCRYGLKKDDWVEIVDDDTVLHCKQRHLVQIIDVNRDDLTVAVDEGNTALPSYKPEDYEGKHILLRRWDQNTGDQEGIPVNKGTEDGENWIDLEEGLQIQFDTFDNNQVYQSGDYWLIPARTATGNIAGNIEWPKDIDGNPIALLPHGVIHHYAPLAIIAKKPESTQLQAYDLRRKIKIWEYFEDSSFTPSQ